MNIAELSIRKKVVTLTFTFLITAAGITAFQNLGRLEDPEFTIKEAQVITRYPGASAIEVEQEVSDVIETAVQQLSQLKRVESTNTAGLSIVQVVIEDKYDKSTLPQVWDELRRKVNDAQANLPPGALPSVVFDDFGDVFGILLAAVGPDYSYKELEEFVDFLRKELLLVPDVAKVTLTGVQPQEVHVDISRAKIAQLGISLKEIYKTLEGQNLVKPAGSVRVGDYYVRITPTGKFQTVDQIGDLLLRGDASGNMIYLRDVADISRGYQTPPELLVRHNQEKAIAIGVSIKSGGNVVRLGEAINAKLHELKPQVPLGIDLEVITYQSEGVTASINGFLVSLIEALAIVIGILMIFMGLRSGVLIGAILLLTVLGTFLGMQIWGINLERISLGALIIALGMLVDNAIVVTEGMLIKIEVGVDRIKAARDVVAQTAMPLFGATVIAILAFAAIGLSQDSTGEYTRSLFQVILISLMLSWIIAITITPLFCHMMLKGGDKKDENEDPYKGAFFKVYRNSLKACLKLRWITVGVLIAMLTIAIIGFGQLENSFFPNSTRPQFMVHYWLPEGTDIRKTSNDMLKLEEFILKQDGVTSASSFIGQGAPRFVLTYQPEKKYRSYGIILVNVDDYRKIDGLMDTIDEYGKNNFINAQINLRKFVLGPGKEYSIEARFSGSDPSVLRSLSKKAKEILRADGGATSIRDNWRQRVKTIKPVIANAQARQAGLTKQDIDQALNMNFSGSKVGVYREEDKLLNILSRAPANERNDIDNLENIQIWSDVTRSAIPFRQVINGVETGWEDAVVQRRNRKRTITTQASQKTGNASVVFERVKPKIEAIPLPLGYELQWGGEYQDSTDAQVALFSKIPPTIVLVVLILIMLFNSIRQPLIICLTVPLSVIGVVVGLLLTAQPFGFMALLGFLSLAGMLIKNAIVLIDQINVEIQEGKEPMEAIIDSSVSRLRPVSMAAMTTVLGMIPLLMDVFFIGMAVTIMAGLTFATILTLIVVPVLYAILYRVK